MQNITHVTIQVRTVGRRFAHCAEVREMGSAVSGQLLDLREYGSPETLYTTRDYPWGDNGAAAMQDAREWCAEKGLTVVSR